jgi:hypothetical protein
MCHTGFVTTKRKIRETTVSCHSLPNQTAMRQIEMLNQLMDSTAIWPCFCASLVVGMQEDFYVTQKNAGKI